MGLLVRDNLMSVIGVLFRLWIEIRFGLILCLLGKYLLQISYGMGW